MKTGQQSQSQSDIAETAQTNKKSGEELARITDIPNSPFRHVKQGDKEYITIGNHIIYECNLIEALKLVKDKDWNVITNLIVMIHNHLNKIQK